MNPNTKALLGALAIFVPIAISFITSSSFKKRESTSTRNKPYNQPRKDIKPYSPQPKKPQDSPSKPRKPGPSRETIEAMHVQADAERAIAEALERKAEHTPDPVKRARIARQAANSWLRFNKILDQIDKITQQ